MQIHKHLFLIVKGGTKKFVPGVIEDYFAPHKQRGTERQARYPRSFWDNLGAASRGHRTTTRSILGTRP